MTRALPVFLLMSCAVAVEPAAMPDAFGPVHLLQQPASRSWATWRTEGAPWHLDELDGRDGAYACDNGCGAGAVVYVLDTGCHPAAPCTCAFDAVGEDCRAETGLHGSQVADLVRQAAPGAEVRSVRLFDGERSDIRAGLEWLAAHADSGAAAVMAFYVPGYTHQVCMLVEKLRVRGVRPFVAAGNLPQPAEQTGSPQNCPASMTVGAYDRDGRRADWSAFDATLYAPGERVCTWSPWGESCTSGTSLSAPLAAAVYTLAGGRPYTRAGSAPGEHAVYLPVRIDASP